MAKNKENKSELTKKPGLLDRTDEFLSKRRISIFYFSLFGLILFSLLLFQANISIGGDDSFYVIRAQKFLQDGKFPSFQGPLYPLMLSPVIAIFGIKVHLLKTFSILFTAVFLILFYHVFKNRISNVVLVIAMLLLAFNHEVLYFASQTYNEAFHLMIQLIFFYQFFKVYEMLNGGDADIKTQYKQWLLLGFSLFLVTITKNLGLVALITVTGFFLIQWKWKAMLAGLLSWGAFTGLFNLFKRIFFDTGATISKQGNMLLYKDPYNFSKGKEDLAGFVNRFIENSNVYLSKNMMKILSIRDADVTSRIELLTVIVVLLMIFGLFIAYKRNKLMFFTGAYLSITLAVVFIVLQVRWDADRLVFLTLPFFVVFMLYVFDQIARKSKIKLIQPLFLVVMVIYLFSSAASSTENIDLLKLKKNLSGDKYLGYTTDWQNFLSLSEWSGKNLPETAYVASRKSAMSSIYANGKRFFGISRVPSQDADTLLDILQDNNVTHVIMAKLRKNPKEKSEYTINTVQRFLATIEKQYPGTFRAVYQAGQTNDEEAILFQVNYNVRANRKNFP
jgi:hypothetical protein